MTDTNNVNIADISELPTPEEVKEAYPLSAEAAQSVTKGRKQIRDILGRRDKRLLMIVGPCSIHSSEDAFAYAERLQTLARRVEDRILIVMRVYFEKPRTTLGWKGLVYDPDLDNSGNIFRGLHLARHIMLEVAGMGLPTATEILEPIIPQYITDALCWTAIGARTAESQTHRQMASGLSTPIGFKNATDGDMNVAVQALSTAASAHTFIGITSQGRIGLFNTCGNTDTHLVLRGGKSGPNYESPHVAFARELLRKQGISPNIMVDCSHGNSGKDPEQQAVVLKDVVRQIVEGEQDLIGVMLESNLKGGKQKIQEAGEELEPGVSVTDACLDWDQTESLVLETYDRLGSLYSN